MTTDSTRPTAIPGAAGLRIDPSQHTEITWSFSSPAEHVVGALDQSIAHPRTHLSQNVDGPSTLNPQKIVSPLSPGVAIRRRDAGKRSFQVLSEWQGVVEEVNGTSFRCRLVPLENGQPNLARIEFTDFSLDDIANDDDRALVGPGAVFYWTIGRSQNAAGTRTNVSLVRFRRLPSPGSYQRRVARREAEKLLRDFGEIDRSDVTST